MLHASLYIYAASCLGLCTPGPALLHHLTLPTLCHTVCGCKRRAMKALEPRAETEPAGRRGRATRSQARAAATAATSADRSGGGAAAPGDAPGGPAAAAVHYCRVMRPLQARAGRPAVFAPHARGPSRAVRPAALECDAGGLGTALQRALPARRQ